MSRAGRNRPDASQQAERDIHRALLCLGTNDPGEEPTWAEDIAQAALITRANGAVRVIDTTDGTHILIRCEDERIELTHARHPAATSQEAQKLRAFFQMTSALQRAARKFMSKKTGNTWTPLKHGARRRLGARSLWNLYDSFYRTETASLCEFIRERDRRALRKLERLANELTDAGHAVSIVTPENATESDVRCARLVAALKEAQSGEDLAAALLNTPAAG